MARIRVSLRLELRRTHRQYSTRKYVQEHDYTVKPTTYVYTADENREVFERFPLVTAQKHAQRRQRPQKTRMLAREFIEDSMYNPHYGYFAQAAEIFSLPTKLDASKMGSMDTFLDTWSAEYRQQQAPVGKSSGAKSKESTAKGGASKTGPTKSTESATRSATKSTTKSKTKSEPEPNQPGTNLPEHERKNMRRTRVSRQLWHTPSELFSPHYGATLARYMLAQHAKQPPGTPFVVYESGAGNGTLMRDVLDHVQQAAPDVYASAEYHVIEISAALALKQRAQAAGHAARVRVHHTSVLAWRAVEPRPCFVVALEVWDNLAHDVVRYDNETDEPLQGYVVVDPNGDFTEVFSRTLDPLAAEYLAARRGVAFQPQWRLGVHPQQLPRGVRRLVNAVVPFQGQLSPPEYIPTRQFEFTKVLARCFTNHALIAADFTHFSERIRGYSSPVVQTFMENTPVTVGTYMVLQGHFDIMFPTDFRLAAQMYERVTGRPAAVAPHGEFLRRWAGDLAPTTTQTGENPMLALYSNAAFLTS